MQEWSKYKSLERVQECYKWKSPRAAWYSGPFLATPTPILAMIVVQEIPKCDPGTTCSWAQY